MKRALLIGSQTGGLTGVDGDVERMSAALDARGFAIQSRTGADASRDGILAAYEKLIADSASSDAVCLYYSGHGGFALNPQFAPGRPVPQFLQYLIPTDDGPQLFRGIMSFELSRLLARLSEKTANVTAIFDCCHSAQMSRAARARHLRPKASGPRVSPEQLATLLRDAGAADALVDAESNPRAVRLVAAEADSIAYEGENEQGEASGLFTQALLRALQEAAGERVSWAALILRVRELVMAQMPEQRPDAEGPRRRRLWDVEQVPDERPLALFFNGEQACIRGGALLGVVTGARYGVMPPLAESYQKERALADAVVEEVHGGVAAVRLEPAWQGPQMAGLLAFPLEVPFRKCPVALAHDVPVELRDQLASSRLLSVVELTPGELAASVAREGDQLVLRDPLGLLMGHTPLNAARELIERLERIARAEDLRRLEPGSLNARLQIALGRIENGTYVPMQEGEALHVGDRQYVEITNRGYSPVYVAVFGIDAGYTVRLLSRRAARGVRLAQKGVFDFGRNAAGQIVGIDVSWPDGLPSDEPRRETLLVIAADSEQEFSLLTTDGVRGETRGAASALERRLQQTRGGLSRSRGEPSSTERAEYALRRVEYQLHPEPRTGVRGR